MVKISSEFKLELIENLKMYFKGFLEYYVKGFDRLTGADTITYAFNLICRTQKTMRENRRVIPLILRIYRGNAGIRSKHEFIVLKNLFDANLQVPKPYFFKSDGSCLGRSYMVMDKIPGVPLTERFQNTTSSEETGLLFSSFIGEMVKLHGKNWKEMGLDMKEPDLNEDPFIFIKNQLQHPKELILQYHLEELYPLIEWLEKNMVPSEKLCILHGDFHPNNLIITPEDKLYTIDWSNICLGDIRFEIGFSIVSVDSAGYKLKQAHIDIYESLTDQKIENIEYFMILSHLFNLLRMYSGIINPEITNEDETTKKLFFEELSYYVNYLVLIVKEITGVSLPSLERTVKISR
ncbi:MAG: phosphotransferase family protein [Candidatus Kariarchaeaceae archaeon]